MNNFQFNLFDVFGNVLPGFVILITSVTLFQELPFNAENIQWVFGNVDIKSSILILLLSYLLGFMLQFISAWIFKKVISYFVKGKDGNREDYSIGKRGIELSRIRHLSPNNYAIIERFLALRIFSFNMSFALVFLLLGFIISMFYVCKSYEIRELMLIPLALLFSFILMKRAINFLKFVHNVIDDVIETEI